MKPKSSLAHRPHPPRSAASLDQFVARAARRLLPWVSDPPHNVGAICGVMAAALLRRPIADWAEFVAWAACRDGAGAADLALWLNAVELAQRHLELAAEECAVHADDKTIVRLVQAAYEIARVDSTALLTVLIATAPDAPDYMLPSPAITAHASSVHEAAAGSA